MSSDPSKNVTFKWFKGTDKRKKNSKRLLPQNSGTGTRIKSNNSNGTNYGARTLEKDTGMGMKEKGNERREMESNEIAASEEEDEDKLVFSSHESMSTLVVNPSSFTDFTSYYCYAKNTIGWSRDPCTFNLIQSGKHLNDPFLSRSTLTLIDFRKVHDTQNLILSYSTLNHFPLLH